MRYQSHAVCIEDKASGQSIIQELRRDTSLPIIPVKATQDKATRASAITPTIEAGLVSLPNASQWLADFVDECSAFPAGAHDDCVDAFVHGMSFAIKRQSSAPLADDDEDESRYRFRPVRSGSWMSA
jgi:predicted phage terminase large subunit-like protein